MKINFQTRQAARDFAKSRTAKGLTTKVVDNGKDAMKRYAADLNPAK